MLACRRTAAYSGKHVRAWKWPAQQSSTCQVFVLDFSCLPAAFEVRLTPSIPMSSETTASHSSVTLFATVTSWGCQGAQARRAW